jgi:hypothetical protein
MASVYVVWSTALMPGRTGWNTELRVAAEEARMNKKPEPEQNPALVAVVLFLTGWLLSRLLERLLEGL